MVSGLIDRLGSSLSTRDTVETCTPTALAMSTRRDARREPAVLLAAPSLTAGFAVPDCPFPRPSREPFIDPPGIGPASDDSSGRDAAVDHQHGTVQIAPASRGKERDDLGDLRGGADSTGRNRSCPPRESLLVMPDPVSHRRVDQAGAYAVDPDPIRAVIDCQAASELYQATLRGAVRRAQPATTNPGRRGNVHDAAVVRFDHVREEFPASQEGALKIGIDNSVPFRLGKLSDLLDAEHAGHVDEQPWLAELGPDLTRRGMYGGRVAHVH